VLGQNRWSELRSDRFDCSGSGPTAAATIRSISLDSWRRPRVVEPVASLMRLIRVLYTLGCISHHKYVPAKQRQRRKHGSGSCTVFQWQRLERAVQAGARTRERKGIAIGFTYNRVACFAFQVSSEFRGSS